MKTFAKKAVLVGVLVGSVAPSAHALTPAEIKAAIKCRKTIAAQAAALVKAELGAVDKSHKARNKGKTTVDCNAIATADLKGKVAASEPKAAAKIDKACGPADVTNAVLKNYLPDGNVDGNVFPALRAVVEGSSGALLGTPGLTGQKSEKALIKCHGTLAGERSKIIDEILKSALKCQAGQDKVATEASDFAAIAGSCAAPGPKPKHEDKIAKACGAVVGADGTQVGSCNGLPECLVNEARASGETLAAAIFGQPAECGNGVPEPGEACDDGNLVNGDGCDANCSVTACGNGIQTAGEECDDGNALDTDGCVGQCKVAVCGDGFVETGREECGDAPTEACANPSEATCQVSQCGPPIGERASVVSLVVPAGKSVGTANVRIDYREDKVRIPGIGEDDGVKSRVVLDPSVQGFSTRIDTDFRLDVTLVLATPLASGPIFTVDFDECAASTTDEYACKVTEAFDPDGNDLTADVHCTIALQ